ncbi:unnamed protein product [Fusarium graminearum]|nr:unnamed protein product [Fusarium graminearum]
MPTLPTLCLQLSRACLLGFRKWSSTRHPAEFNRTELFARDFRELASTSDPTMDAQVEELGTDADDSGDDATSRKGAALKTSSILKLLKRRSRNSRPTLKP